MRQAGTLAFQSRHVCAPSVTFGTFMYVPRVSNRSVQPAGEQSLLSANFKKEYRVMISKKSYRVFLLAMVCAILFATAPSALCQNQSSSPRVSVRDDDTNLDTQLYLILATNREI